MSKFTRLLAEINVAACQEALDYNAETKARTAKITKDGQKVWELTIPVKTKIKKGDLVLEGLEFEKLNSLIKLEPGTYIVELEMFTMNAKGTKIEQTFFRVNCLANNNLKNSAQSPAEKK